MYSNRTKKRIKPGALPIIEPQRNISVENNCAGKKNIFFKVTKKSNKTTRKVLYDIESHFLLFPVHSPDSFGILIVGNVPEPILTVKLAENSANWEHIIECSDPAENIRESNVAKECTESSTSKEDIRKLNEFSNFLFNLQKRYPTELSLIENIKGYSAIKKGITWKVHVNQ